jgi:hypothetical protein
MQTAPAAAPVIIVPDGLAYDPARGCALPQVSFVYRAVLDWVQRELMGRTLYLAPANHFGADCNEQAAAAAWLHAYQGQVITAPSRGECYIDTRGNAAQLRSYLIEQGLWPLAPAILVCAARHRARAALCFAKEGFALSATVGVTYTIPADEFIVPRLWYYRYPCCHAFYEAAASLRDYCRMPAQKDLPCS